MSQATTDEPVEPQGRPSDRARDARYHGGGAVTPIGLLVGRRRVRQWPVLRWLGLARGKLGGPSSARPETVFRPASHWFSATMLWALAMVQGRSRAVETVPASAAPRTAQHPARRTDDPAGGEDVAGVEDAPAIQVGAQTQLGVTQTLGPGRRLLPRARTSLLLHDYAHARLGSMAMLAPRTEPAKAGMGPVPPEMRTDVRPPSRSPYGAGGNLQTQSPVESLPEQMVEYPTPDLTPRGLGQGTPLADGCPEPLPAQRRPDTGLPGVGRALDDRLLDKAASRAELSGRGHGRRTWAPLALQLPPRMPLVAGEAGESGQTDRVEKPEGPSLPHAGQSQKGLEQRRRFRPTVVREAAWLVKEVRRVVEERMRSDRESPTRRAEAPLPPASTLDPADVWRMAQREARERAFRMGR